MKRKRAKKIFTMSLIVLVIGLSITYIVFVRIPVEYAVRLEDIDMYPNSILVREAWHTGTGWEKVGDTTGYYDSKLYEDVNLTGNTPPTASIGGNHVNTYLCQVRFTGYFILAGTDIQFEEYVVKEWYPIYPVKRNTILPSWFYPDGYLSRIDF